ncbi:MULTISPECIES: hypothetical protein [Legionella]|uniref:Uncharacterized protein n=1 Tax=Legionella maceachernii TaxID=466 RepID=A0A0W0VYL8_9GAMM|nr:hypothetical protein [Legionella maceachernii]KTD25192.1 hypothetical protein Lmac_2170 [Legionella maceachernii]SJZ76052.1 hypothetical protein SAMN02745128_00962 [Legionella maceachernii]SUP03148.1 Uncharacterised protein [Legionella maceachernii]
MGKFVIRLLLLLFALSSWAAEMTTEEIQDQQNDQQLCEQQRVNQCLTTCEKANGNHCMQACEENAKHECRQAGE